VVNTAAAAAPLAAVLTESGLERGGTGCKMSGCGNRAKVAGFRARQSSGQASATAPGTRS
jgi:CGNR zinc finger